MYRQQNARKLVNAKKKLFAEAIDLLNTSGERGHVYYQRLQTIFIHKNTLSVFCLVFPAVH